MDAIANVTSRLIHECKSTFVFGSQIEGTTTPGLYSDTDILYCYNKYSVIQNTNESNEWQFDHTDLIMIQDENIPPGYCFLQPYGPLPIYSDNFRELLANYNGDTIVMKNNYFDYIDSGVKHGPARSFKEKGSTDHDRVPAFPCKNLPETVRSWLNQQIVQGRISNEMKSYIENNNCYVVAVGMKGTQYEKIQWRISTPHAERCVMMNLNITQIHCYVLMKMILKTYHLHPDGNNISSFMCKNILLRYIAKTDPDVWCSKNLLTVFQSCLIELKTCLELETCPHFIIHQNNLMAKKFTQSLRQWLIEQINFVIKNPWLAICCVEIDDVGLRLRKKYTVLNAIPAGLNTPDEIAKNILVHLECNVIRDVSRCCLEIFENLMSGEQNTVEIISSLTIINFEGDNVNMEVCSLLAPFIRSTYGSEMAAENIKSGNTVSPEAIKWLEYGLSSDAASSRLKMASVLYSSGDFIKAKLVLESIEKKYEQNIIETLCGCYIPRGWESSREFLEMAGNKVTVDVLQNNIACCVRFLPSEIHCVPHELQFETFRSSLSDSNAVQHIDENDKWMKMAVVDSLPFLYFLEYKTYSRLHHPADQQGAFDKIISSILRTKNLGHKETAFNLLGQIMEEKKDIQMHSFTTGNLWKSAYGTMLRFGTYASC